MAIRDSRLDIFRQILDVTGSYEEAVARAYGNQPIPQEHLQAMQAGTTGSLLQQQVAGWVKGVTTPQTFEETAFPTFEDIGGDPTEAALRHAQGRGPAAYAEYSERAYEQVGNPYRSAAQERQAEAVQQLKGALPGTRIAEYPDRIRVMIRPSGQLEESGFFDIRMGPGGSWMWGTAAGGFVIEPKATPNYETGQPRITSPIEQVVDVANRMDVALEQQRNINAAREARGETPSITPARAAHAAYLNAIGAGTPYQEYERETESGPRYVGETYPTTMPAGGQYMLGREMSLAPVQASAFNLAYQDIYSRAMGAQGGRGVPIETLQEMGAGTLVDPKRTRLMDVQEQAYLENRPIVSSPFYNVELEGQPAPERGQLVPTRIEAGADIGSGGGRYAANLGNLFQQYNKGFPLSTVTPDELKGIQLGEGNVAYTGGKATAFQLPGQEAVGIEAGQWGKRTLSEVHVSLPQTEQWRKFYQELPEEQQGQFRFTGGTVGSEGIPVPTVQVFGSQAGTQFSVKSGGEKAFTGMGGEEVPSGGLLLPMPKSGTESMWLQHVAAGLAFTETGRERLIGAGVLPEGWQPGQGDPIKWSREMAEKTLPVAMQYWGEQTTTQRVHESDILRYKTSLLTDEQKEAGVQPLIPGVQGITEQGGGYYDVQRTTGGFNLPSVFTQFKPEWSFGGPSLTSEELTQLFAQNPERVKAIMAERGLDPQYAPIAQAYAASTGIPMREGALGSVVSQKELTGAMPGIMAGLTEDVLGRKRQLGDVLGAMSTMFGNRAIDVGGGTVLPGAETIRKHVTMSTEGKPIGPLPRAWESAIVSQGTGEAAGASTSYQMVAKDFLSTKSGVKGLFGAEMPGIYGPITASPAAPIDVVGIGDRQLRQALQSTLGRMPSDAEMDAAKQHLSTVGGGEGGLTTLTRRPVSDPTRQLEVSARIWTQEMYESRTGERLGASEMRLSNPLMALMRGDVDADTAQALVDQLFGAQTGEGGQRSLVFKDPGATSSPQQVYEQINSQLRAVMPDEYAKAEEQARQQLVKAGQPVTPENLAQLTPNLVSVSWNEMSKYAQDMIAGGMSKDQVQAELAKGLGSNTTAEEFAQKAQYELIAKGAMGISYNQFMRGVGMQAINQGQRGQDVAAAVANAYQPWLDKARYDPSTPLGSAKTASWGLSTMMEINQSLTPGTGYFRGMTGEITLKDGQPSTPFENVSGLYGISGVMAKAMGMFGELSPEQVAKMYSSSTASEERVQGLGREIGKLRSLYAGGATDKDRAVIDQINAVTRGFGGPEAMFTGDAPGFQMLQTFMFERMQRRQEEAEAGGRPMPKGFERLATSLIESGALPRGTDAEVWLQRRGIEATERMRAIRGWAGDKMIGTQEEIQIDELAKAVATQGTPGQQFAMEQLGINLEPLAQQSRIQEAEATLASTSQRGAVVQAFQDALNPMPAQAAMGAVEPALMPVENMTVAELNAELRQANVPGRSGATTKAAKQALLQTHRSGSAAGGGQPPIGGPPTAVGGLMAEPEDPGDVFRGSTPPGPRRGAGAGQVISGESKEAQAGGGQGPIQAMADLVRMITPAGMQGILSGEGLRFFTSKDRGPQFWGAAQQAIEGNAPLARDLASMSEDDYAALGSIARGDVFGRGGQLKGGPASIYQAAIRMSEQDPSSGIAQQFTAYIDKLEQQMLGGAGTSASKNAPEAMKLFTERVTEASEGLKGMNERLKDMEELQRPLTRSEQRQMRQAGQLAGQMSDANIRLAQQYGGISEAEAEDLQLQRQMVQERIQGVQRGQIGLQEGGRGMRLREQLAESSFGTDAPGMGAADKVINDLTSGWTLFRLNRVWGMTGGWAMNQIPAAAEREQAAMTAGAMDTPMGQYQPSDMTRSLMGYQAARQDFSANVGQAAYGAWGWTQQALGPGMATAAGIGAPALGAGLIGGQLANILSGGALSTAAVGLPLAAGAAALGGVMYSANQMSDRSKMGISLSEGDPGFWNWNYRLAQGREAIEETPWLRRAVEWGLGDDQKLFGVDLKLGERGSGQSMREFGKQAISGDLTGLNAQEQQEVLLYQAQQATEKGGALDWMSETSALQAAAEWRRYTPEATNAQAIFNDPRFAQMAQRGMAPAQFAQMAQQRGMGPQQWQTVMDQAMSVSEPQMMQNEFVYGQWQGLQNFGIEGQQIANMAYGGQLGQLNQMEQLNLGRLQRGSQYAWSELGLSTGQNQWVTTNPETGMGIGTNWGGDILGQRLGQTGAAGQNVNVSGQNITFNVTGQTVGFNEWDIQDYQIGQQRGYEDWQTQFRREGMALQYSYTTGEGGAYAGRGQWQMEDEARALSRAYQTQQFGFQTEQTNLSDRQFKESWNVNWQQLGTQEDWWQRDFAEQNRRRQTQFGWQLEDLAFRGQQSTLQFGWNMEDLEESERFATGRDRRKIQRQKERAAISYGMGMGQLETQEGRIREQMGWADTDQAKEEERHNTRLQWQREEMQLQLRHHNENLDLQRRRQTAAEKYFTDTNALQDKQTQINREYWKENYERQEEALEKEIEYRNIMREVQDAQLSLNRAQQLQMSQWAAAWDSGGPMRRAFTDFLDWMKTQIKSAQNTGATTYVPSTTTTTKQPTHGIIGGR